MKLESQDFDNKLKSATANLQHMEREVRRTGATFEYADKEELEFLKSLGQMETKALDAKGKIKELSNSYKELAMMYQRMTKEEKESQPGKALAASLQQLKARLNETKESFANVSKEIGEGGSGGLSKVVETLGSKIGIPAGAFTALGGAMAAGAAAAKIAKDAFMNMESGIDEWGRTVEGAKGAYSVFLDTLNGGNWSGFFTNLQAAIGRARELYDAMDRLGSIKANNASAIAKEQATIQELRLRQEKGENVANELREAEERLRKLQTQSVEQGKKAGELSMYNTIRDRVNATKLDRKDKTTVDDAAINAAIQEILTSGQDAMDKYAQVVKDTLKKVDVEHYDYYKGEKYYTQDWSKLTDQEKQAYKLALAITEGETKLQQGIDIYAKAVQEGAASAREARKVETAAKKGAAKEPVEPVLPEGSIAKLQDELKKANEKFNLAGTDEERAAAKKSIDEITASIEKLQGKTKETAQEGSIAYMRQQLQELQKQWELAADPATREELKKQIGEVTTALGEMEGKNKTATSALSMWGDHQAKIDETMNLLRQFYTMMDDPNIGEGQRKWAEDMAKSYEEQLKKMMGDTDAAVATMQDSLNQLSSGVGAISTIGNAFNELKSIGDGLASAFSGEMDAWDAMMTVFNSGIGVIQTVMSVMEAINTLTEISAALKQKNAIAATTEAAAVVAGKGTETAATTSEMAVEATATGVTAGKAAASAGDAVAGIPIVGPILAVAAVAAVLAAILASVSKAKSSAGNFSTGGIVPGNSYSGDNLSIGVNSQELVLNRAQTSNLASQLNSNPMGNLRLSTEISGSNLRVVLNNDNRQRGGSRNVYGVH